MNLLDLFLAIVFVAGFVLCTAAIAIAVGAPGDVPAQVNSFLRAVAGGQEPVPEGRRGWAVVVFGAIVIGVLAVQAVDLVEQLGKSDVSGIVTTCAQFAAETIWIVYLWLRRAARTGSAGTP